MSKINNIFFNKVDDFVVSILICLDSGVSGEYNITSKKYLRYIDKIRKSLIGMEVFDQVSIDEKLINLNIDRSLCMGISSAVMKVASKEEDVELFYYISEEFYIPSFVVDINGVFVKISDYWQVKPFLSFLDSCSWNVNIDEIKKISLKYRLKLFSDNYKLIDINKLDTVTSIFDFVDEYSDSTIMICGDDIVYDLAVSLGLEYIKLGKDSNFDRFLEIVNLIDIWYYFYGDDVRIYNIVDRPEFLEEVAVLTLMEWGSYKNQDEFQLKVSKKIKKIKDNFDNKYYCKLLLLDDNKLIGFISLFETDGDERTDLKPWYATMYVKREYRGNGFSKILNNAILEEARRRGFYKIYLKSDLVNYYEKFGAKYMEDLNNGEKLYYIDLKS